MSQGPRIGGIWDPNSDYTLTGTYTGGTFNGATFGPSAQSIGTLPASTVTAVEYGNGVIHQTVLTLSALALAISDANVGGGTKIYTFPKGRIAILDASASVAETTTSVIASTLNSGVTLSAGVGSVQTVAQASGTLVTTEQDIVNAFAPVSSTTINVAAAAAVGKISATTVIRYDGTATAQAIFLNCGVPTNTDIDADATTTWSGTVTLLWTFNGTV